MIFTKNKEGVRAIRAIKYKKMWLENILRTRTFDAEVLKSNIFESKDNTTRMKIVN